MQEEPAMKVVACGTTIDGSLDLGSFSFFFALLGDESRSPVTLSTAQRLDAPGTPEFLTLV